jgi:hypothetical protein
MLHKAITATLNSENWQMGMEINSSLLHAFTLVATSFYIGLQRITDSVYIHALSHCGRLIILFVGRKSWIRYRHWNQIHFSSQATTLWEWLESKQ